MRILPFSPVFGGTAVNRSAAGCYIKVTGIDCKVGLSLDAVVSGGYLNVAVCNLDRSFGSIFIMSRFNSVAGSIDGNRTIGDNGGISSNQTVISRGSDGDIAGENP